MEVQLLWCEQPAGSHGTGAFLGAHPFYTGSQKILDTEGRVERFMRKYGIKNSEE